MGRNWKQLKLLLWKNFLLQTRKPIATIIELVLPVLFVLILLVIRLTLSHPDDNPGIRSWNPFSLGNRIPNEVTGQNRSAQWKIAFTPNDTKYFNIMKIELPKFLSAEAIPFFNDKDLLNNIENDLDNDISKQKFLCGVVFTKHPDDQETQYYLRFPADARSPYVGLGEERLGSGKIEQWFTSFVFPRSFTGLGARTNDSDFGGPPYYYEEGFTTVQKAIDFAIISEKNKANTNLPELVNIDIEMQRFPYPKVVVDPFIIAIQQGLPLLLMLALLYTCVTIVKSIAEEKEKRLKVSMNMNFFLFRSSAILFIYLDSEA